MEYFSTNNSMFCQIFWFDREEAPGPGGEVRVTPAADEEWMHLLNTTWDWPRLKQAINLTLTPYKRNVTKFLPLADMEAKQVCSRMPSHTLTHALTYAHACSHVCARMRHGGEAGLLTHASQHTRQADADE